MKGNKRNKIRVLDVIMVLLILVFVGSGGVLGYYFWTSQKEQSAFSNLPTVSDFEANTSAVVSDSSTEEGNYVPENASARQQRCAELQKENPECFGWIQIEDTVIDYPVMYTPDDPEKYLHASFDGSYASSGTPFVDGAYEAGAANILIYGHHMKAGTMFAGIMDYEDEEFWKEHQYVHFDTPDGAADYQIIAAFRSQIYPDDGSVHFRYYAYANIQDEATFDEYVDGVKRIAAYDTGIEVSYGQQLITLSTCAYHVTDGRFAIVAVKVSE